MLYHWDNLRLTTQDPAAAVVGRVGAGVCGGVGLGVGLDLAVGLKHGLLLHLVRAKLCVFLVIPCTCMGSSQMLVG